MEQTQEQPVYKYELSIEAVNFLITVLGKVELSGLDNHKNITALVDIFQHPTNLEEMEKANFEAMKQKYEQK